MALRYCCDRFKEAVRVGEIELQMDLLDLVDTGYVDLRKADDPDCFQDDVLEECPFCKGELILPAWAFN